VTGSPETIHQRGRDVVLAGRALLEVPPVPGGTRWGLSLVARPDPAAAEQLQAMAAEAAAPAGPGQWLTASPGSTHLTVTYLEGVHRDIGPDDDAVRRLADIVGRLAAGTPPLRWRVTGLALAERGVLALAEPVDRVPDELRDRVLRELDEVGRAEGYYRRSVWWATLLHFAAPVADPAGLAAWVDARTTSPTFPVISVTADRVDVVRYEYDGARTVPVILASAPLTGVPEGVPDGAQA
jgi:hypothetical protein